MSLDDAPETPPEHVPDNITPDPDPVQKDPPAPEHASDTDTARLDRLETMIDNMVQALAALTRQSEEVIEELTDPDAAPVNLPWTHRGGKHDD